MNAKPCQRHREAITLLGCGVLPEVERVALESHLAQCADCREYFREMQSLADSLAGLAERERQLEPSPAMCARWTREIRALDRAATWRWLPLPRWILAWWWHWSAANRAAFAGLGAVWALVLFFNLSSPSLPQVVSIPVSPREIILALKARPWPIPPESTPPMPTGRSQEAAPRPHSERHVTRTAA